MLNRKSITHNPSLTDALLPKESSAINNNTTNTRSNCINTGAPTIGGTLFLAVLSILIAVIISCIVVLCTGNYNHKEVQENQPMRDMSLLSVKMVLPILAALGVFVNRGYLLDGILSGGNAISQSCKLACNHINTLFSSTPSRPAPGIEPANNQV